MNHLDSLYLRLSNERSRLALAKTAPERDLRATWVAGVQREIEGELKFLASKGIVHRDCSTMSEDELLNELLG